jgi:hypothetical protein
MSRKADRNTICNDNSRIFAADGTFHLCLEVLETPERKIRGDKKVWSDSILERNRRCFGNVGVYYRLTKCEEGRNGICEVTRVGIEEFMWESNAIIPIENAILAEIRAHSPFRIVTSDAILGLDMLDKCCGRSENNKVSKGGVTISWVWSTRASGSIIENKDIRKISARSEGVFC